MLLLLGPQAHPFHLSRCEMDYRPDRQTIEIAIKLFSDDLEEGMNFRFQDKMWLGTDQEHPKADTLLLAYLNEHLHVSVDGAGLAYTWVGKEVGMDVTWLYVECQHVPAAQAFQIQHTSLMELFEDQRNMLDFRCNGQKHSLLFRKGEGPQVVLLEE